MTTIERLINRIKEQAVTGSDEVSRTLAIRSVLSHPMVFLEIFNRKGAVDIIVQEINQWYLQSRAASLKMLQENARQIRRLGYVEQAMLISNAIASILEEDSQPRPAVPDESAPAPKNGIVS
jgi:hypothetical protein